MKYLRTNTNVIIAPILRTFQLYTAIIIKTVIVFIIRFFASALNKILDSCTGILQKNLMTWRETYLKLAGNSSQF